MINMAIKIIEESGLIYVYPGDISHAFISQEKGEIFLKNSNIPKYLASGILNHETNRSRKESMIKTFCERIVEKYPIETYPTFYRCIVQEQYRFVL